MCSLSREPKCNIWPTLSLNFKSWLPPRKHSGTLLSLSLEYAPPSSLPSLQEAPQPTACQKAECINSVFPSKYCVPNPSLSVHIISSHIQLLLNTCHFHLRRWIRFWQHSNLILEKLAWMTSAKKLPLLLLHIFFLLCSPYNLPRVIIHLLRSQPTSLHYINKMQKLIPLTTNQSASFQSSTRSWNPSS